MAEDDDIKLNNTFFNIKEYSQTNCFVSAAAAEMFINCNMSDIKCMLDYMKQIGRWNYDHGSQKKCLPSCSRQDNHFDISLVKFPNQEFPSTHEFVKVIKKLFWSCYPETTRFGYRRWRMDLAYPQLCSFYDKYFYNNTMLSNLLFQGMVQYLGPLISIS